MNERPSPIRIEQELGILLTKPDPRPEFLAGLENQLEAQISNGPHRAGAAGRRAPFSRSGANRPVNWRRLAVIAAAVIMAVLVTIAAIGPQSVLEAVQSLFGYIPGIGFVENVETARLLVAPFKIERDGMVLTITTAEADSQETRLNLTAEGQAHITDLHAREGGNEQVYLLLPSGQELPATGTTSTQQDITHQTATISAQYAFDPLPDKVNDVTLVLPVLPGMADGEAPQDWRIPLVFGPPQKTNQIVGTSGMQWKSASIGKMTMILDRVAQTASGTALRVRFESSDPSIQTASDWWNQLVLTDQTGKSYPVTEQISSDVSFDSAHILTTQPFDQAEQLTLRLDALNLVTNFPQDNSAPGFSFNPGPNPHIGQGWNLDQTVQAAGYRLDLTRAALSQGDEGGYVTAPNGQKLSLIGLHFSFAPQPGLTEVGLRCVKPSPCDGVPSVGNDSSVFVPTLGLRQLPSEPMELKVENLWTTRNGPWVIQWQINSAK
jgi:hypothetical protein